MAVPSSSLLLDCCELAEAVTLPAEPEEEDACEVEDGDVVDRPDVLLLDGFWADIRAGGTILQFNQFFVSNIDGRRIGNSWRCLI